MFINSFDIALSTIGENSLYFKSEYIQSEEKLEEMKKICGFIDDIAAEFNATRLSFKIDEEDMTYSFFITCPEIFASGQNNKFYSLLNTAKYVNFKHKDYESIVVHFKFDGIWNFV